jgi:hypothetical protein
MNIGIRDWSGGIQMTGITTDDVITLDGSFGTITLSGADGIVDVRGTYKNIIDNRTGSPTLTITGAMIPSDVATATALATAQTDLDTITGSDGVTLATAQGNYAPNTVVPDAAGVAPTAIENADALLNRDMSTGTDSGSTTVRTVRQALRMLRNKWSITGTTMTVTKEDDATASWTSELTSDAAADPVTGSNPAGGS